MHWKGYAASSLEIVVVYWCESTMYRKFLQAVEELNVEIKRRLDGAGFHFAFPTQRIRLQTGSDESAPARRFFGAETNQSAVGTKRTAKRGWARAHQSDLGGKRQKGRKNLCGTTSAKGEGNNRP